MKSAIALFGDQHAPYDLELQENRDGIFECPYWSFHQCHATVLELAHVKSHSSDASSDRYQSGH
ncbi:MAG TPA: hypothetical protein V6D37_01030 [Candidatus Sericytochromatia bacterium]